VQLFPVEGSITIGVAGTHSTGKTTLLNHVARKLRAAGYSVARVADLATEARHYGFPILREHTFASTLWIISRGISRELQAQLTAQVVLVDRPVVDALGYLFAALQFRRETISNAKMNYLQHLTCLHASTYAALFKTKIDRKVPIGENKIRDTDIAFRKLAANGIDRVFSELEIPVNVLPMNGTAARQLVLGKIYSLLRD
jgi:predicted ATPase